MKDGITIRLTMKTAEALENVIRGALDTAVDMPRDEWNSLNALCDCLTGTRHVHTVTSSGNKGAV